MSNIKPRSDVKPRNKSDIRPRRITAVCACADSFMRLTRRYMDTRDAATLNISCFTCGRKPEANDAFADQTLMSCEKYVKWRNGHNSQLESERLPERCELSADREQTRRPKYMGAAWKAACVMQRQTGTACS